MLVRLAFVLLCLANIALAAWLWLGQPYTSGALPPGDPGVPMLQLLSELPASAATATAADAGVAANVEGAVVAGAGDGQRCIALGPFATPQDLRAARQALAGNTMRARARQEQASETGSWWVYLPEASNRAQALARARQLADRRISDYFVVSSGEHANSVSLGLFKDPANARRRRDEVIAAGFPARMTQRAETVPEYWLDLVLAAGTRIDPDALHLDGVQSHPAACF